MNKEQKEKCNAKNISSFLISISSHYLIDWAAKYDERECSCHFEMGSAVWASVEVRRGKATESQASLAWLFSRSLQVQNSRNQSSYWLEPLLGWENDRCSRRSRRMILLAKSPSPPNILERKKCKIAPPDVPEYSRAIWDDEGKEKPERPKEKSLKKHKRNVCSTRHRHLSAPECWLYWIRYRSCGVCNTLRWEPWTVVTLVPVGGDITSRLVWDDFPTKSKKKNTRRRVSFASPTTFGTEKVARMDGISC